MSFRKFLSMLNPWNAFKAIFGFIQVVILKINPVRLLETLLKICLLSLITIILYSHQLEINKIKPEVGTLDNIPYDAFAQVEIGIKINSPEESFEFGSTGSGILVDYANGVSTIITADHVCNPPPLDKWYALVGRENIEKKITLKTFYGHEVEGEVVLNDSNYDLCLIRAEVEWSTPVRISAAPPALGEKVFNIAAPTGFFYPGVVPILEGRYSGDIGYNQDYDSIHTVYTKRGSSGSGVLNHRGEIVGIIHSAIGDLEHLGISSTWYEVNDFMLTYEILFY